MGCVSWTKLVVSILVVVSAIPIGILIALESGPHSTRVYHYHSNGWFRECVKWDDLNRRFIVSYLEGGVGVVNVPDDDEVAFDEITAFRDADLSGNASLGLTIDRPRNRLLVAVADVAGNRYGGLAAYDLSSWRRLFLAHLSGPDDEKSLADDVAVDEEGNAYVTDAKASKIWKVSVDGKLSSTITSPLFTFKEWYKNLIALNGIVYHPDGYLLVIHTSSGALYKIGLNKGDHDIKLVKIVTGSLVFGDGLQLVSPSKVVVAGIPSGRLLESSDGWETASVTGKFGGPMHRFVTAATVKDDKVYFSYLAGLGYPKRKHVLVEANFKK